MNVRKWGNAIWESDLPALQASALTALIPHLDEETGRLTTPISEITRDHIDDDEIVSAMDQALTSPWVIRQNGSLWARRPDVRNESVVVANRLVSPSSGVESAE